MSSIAPSHYKYLWIYFLLGGYLFLNVVVYAVAAVKNFKENDLKKSTDNYFVIVPWSIGSAMTLQQIIKMYILLSVIRIYKKFRGEAQIESSNNNLTKASRYALNKWRITELLQLPSQSLWRLTQRGQIYLISTKRSRRLVPPEELEDHRVSPLDFLSLSSGLDKRQTQNGQITVLQCQGQGHVFGANVLQTAEEAARIRLGIRLAMIFKAIPEGKYGNLLSTESIQYLRSAFAIWDNGNGFVLLIGTIQLNQQRIWYGVDH